MIYIGTGNHEMTGGNPATLFTSQNLVQYPQTDTAVKAAQKKENWNARYPLPYSRTIFRFKPLTGYVRANLVNKPQYYQKMWPHALIAVNDVPSGGYPVIPVITDNEARKRFNENLIAAKAQAIVMVKERAEAIKSARRLSLGVMGSLDKHYRGARADMLRNEMLRIKHKSDGTKAGYLKHASPRLAKDISDYWLEWNFSIKPTISDLNDTTKQIITGSTRRYKVTGVSMVNLEDRNLNRSDWGGDPWIGYAYSRLDGDRSVTNIIKYGCVLEAPQDVSIPEKLGFSPEAVLPQVYEMIPWSFVADYFTNLGDLVTAVSALSVKTLGLYKSTLMSTKENLTHSYSNNGYWNYNVVSTPFRGYRESTTFTRQITGIITIPTWEWKSPSAMQNANLLALAVSSFVKKPGLFSPLF